RLRAGGPPADRDGSQDGAVQARGGLRPGHRRGPRPGRPGRDLGIAGDPSDAGRDRDPERLDRPGPRRPGDPGVSEARSPIAPGPGSGPGGVPTALAVSPILSARVRAQDLDRLREAAPGSRIVNLSAQGLADGPVEDVEVLLRGWLSSEAFDRLLARAPRLRWVHSATSGVERALTPAARERGIVVTN